MGSFKQVSYMLQKWLHLHFKAWTSRIYGLVAALRKGPQVVWWNNNKKIYIYIRKNIWSQGKVHFNFFAGQTMKWKTMPCGWKLCKTWGQKFKYSKDQFVRGILQSGSVIIYKAVWWHMFGWGLQWNTKYTWICDWLGLQLKWMDNGVNICRMKV